MASALAYNDFGKFFYSAQLFLSGDNMYAPNPATSIGVGGGRAHVFLNMNPPHAHLPLLLLAPLSIQVAAVVWSIASAVGLIASFAIALGELGIRPTPRGILFGVLAASVFSATGAIVITGQLSFLLLPVITLAWRGARREAWARAGTWLGVAISIKPFLLVFIPYFVLRRHWAAVTAAAVTMVAAFSVGVAVFGVDAHREWIRALGTTDWEWAAMNASVLGLLSRALGDSPYYTPLAVLPSGVWLVWLTASVLIAMGTFVAIRNRPAADADSAFLLLLLAALLISPLGWIYYLWLPLGPALARFLSPGDRSESPPVRWLLWLALPGLVWPLSMIFVGQPSGVATVTVGSIYFWSTLFLWLAALADALPAFGAKPSASTPLGR